MRGQGQGGRFNYGQIAMPKLKATKKKAVLRPRKIYGSYRARQVPRRYELYDILEEIDKTIPPYTIISEPEEPLDPVLDVPLSERYPWAGSLEKVNKEKHARESDPEHRMEPYFGDFTRSNLPPLGRRQKIICRRGWPTYNWPKWINRPLIGTEIRVNNRNHPYLKDRRPEMWQLPRWEQRKIRREQRMAAQQAKEEEVEEEDDLDDLLGAGDD